MTNSNLYNVQPSKLATWLINHSAGLVKTERQANLVLIVISVIVIGVSMLYIFDVRVLPQPNAPIEDDLLLEL